MSSYRIGMVGLGTMGKNLLLNIADKGYAIAGYDKNPDAAKELNSAEASEKVKGFTDLQEFVASLQQPRTIIMLVPAGKIVDYVIADLKPLINKGDLLIDGGNSKFTDTERRSKALEEEGIHFFGMGISGGEEGARHGPSLMPGGTQDAYERVRPILEDIAAKAQTEPCVAYIGPGASGHFVKMVHNGIEYAQMQLLAETYDLLKNNLNLPYSEIHLTFKRWNEGRLKSYLLEISRDILSFKESGSDGYLLDEIRDVAKSKGTGKWTSQFAMDLQAPVPSIDAAVSMRDLSKYKPLRTALAASHPKLDASDKPGVATDAYLEQLEQALYFSMISTFGQGMHLLARASEEYNWNLNLGDIAKIWRAGCIIRAEFLEVISAAFQRDVHLPHLFQDIEIRKLLASTQPAARSIVSDAIHSDLSLPVFSASLNYYNSLRSRRLPTNLIQAQRDYFGAHTYEKSDHEGTFHTDWSAPIDS